MWLLDLVAFVVYLAVTLVNLYRWYVLHTVSSRRYHVCMAITGIVCGTILLVRHPIGCLIWLLVGTIVGVVVGVVRAREIYKNN